MSWWDEFIEDVEKQLKFRDLKDIIKRFQREAKGDWNELTEAVETQIQAFLDALKAILIKIILECILDNSENNDNDDIDR